MHLMPISEPQSLILPIPISKRDSSCFGMVGQAPTSITLLCLRMCTLKHTRMVWVFHLANHGACKARQRSSSLPWTLPVVAIGLGVSLAYSNLHNHICFSTAGMINEIACEHRLHAIHLHGRRCPVATRSLHGKRQRAKYSPRHQNLIMRCQGAMVQAHSLCRS